ncbi:fructosamine kinase family protein [uncultured Eudoraea sp.]|uniref:fructosamine kinase family protein n=1 Tax=uncultured Eudoraea sp. TaxID=1035614 RepID=UPI00262ABB30|nr:fructosamine kinase family protein [uncultured Eudoraea sp.]
MKPEVKDSIGLLLGTKINKCVPVSGGDISRAFVLYTTADRVFCKINSSAAARSMFEAEADGLDAISKTKTLKTPNVYAVGELEEGACLLMEYVPSKSPDPEDLEVFGAQLAAMHQTASPYFGWENSNFIGSLPQSNQKHDNWVSFYINERLIPQFQLAIHQKLLAKNEIPGSIKLQTVISSYCSDVNPSLLHGDLWGGNYLIAENGAPYLIDPAIYFGHSEIDLSMSRLFGGFGSAFYKAYYEINPCQPGESNRMAVYQLYYLLVHLNLFGRSYYQSVKNIVNTHFN